MTVKTFFIIIACLVLTISCRDNRSADERDNLNSEENEFSPVDRNIPRVDVDDEDFEENEETDTNRDNTSNTESVSPDGNNRGNRITANAMTGQYIKKGQESDSSCGCYCLNLSTDTTELCLVAGGMYISSRLQRNADNTIDVFLVEPSARNTQGKDMPWKDFDRNTSIATIKPASNGEVEFDWLGFKINGDLAVDYAIFGKKTLEGSYKRK